MAIHRCSACYIDTIQGTADQWCYHQMEVLKNPYFFDREYYILMEKEKINFFESLKSFSIQNIL